MPSDSAPLVTVVVPAYNAGRYVEEAVRSAQRQTYENVEIVVVDDGSADDTAERVLRLCAGDARVRLLRQENSGVAVARNRGIAAARGSLVAPLDADDVWYPTKLERQVSAMMGADATVGLVYTGWDRIDGEGHRIPGSVRLPTVEGWVADRLVVGNFISCASTPLVRKACLDAVGGYDDHRRFGGQGCEDWDLYLRVAERYRFAFVPACLVSYRQAPESMSANCRGMRGSYDVMVARLAERRPALGPRLRRRSRQKFYRYLSGMSRRNGDRRGGRYWMWKAFLAEPEAFAARAPRRLAAFVVRPFTRRASSGHAPPA